jgi:hypothetical protein
VDCDDGVDCTVDSCNENTDSCDSVPDDGFCDDGLYCTGVESCDVLLDCQPGVAPCPPDICDEVNDTCELACTPSSEPLADYAAKNRYASFETGSPGHIQAVQVTFVSLPGYEYAEGRTMWVQQPRVVTEASGSAGGTPPPTHMAAALGCLPHYMDWSTVGRVDVYDAAIVPGVTVDVRAISDGCDTAIPANFSPPLGVSMSLAGDVVGDCQATPCTPPQGVVDFVDISSVVDKFRNLPAAPRKARADLINSDTFEPSPDGKVDFVDIAYCVDAFRSAAMLLPGPPLTDPCG